MEIQERTLVNSAAAAIKRGDNRSAQILARKALEINIQCPDAWQILYQILGQDTSFKEFQGNYSARYFPNKPQVEVQPILSTPTILQRVESPIPTDSLVTSVESPPEINRNRVETSASSRQRRAEFSTIWASILLLSESGSLVVPIIIIGEIIVKFLVDYAASFQGNFFVGILVGVVAVAVLCFLIPVVGMIIVAVLRLLLIAGVLLGKAFGIGLGLFCALFYYLTLWAPIWTAYIVCTAAGCAAGVIVGYLTSFLGNSGLLSTPGFWSFLHYGGLIVAGGTGGWFFAAAAEASENGTSAPDSNAIISTLQKPARLIGNVITSTEQLSEEGSGLNSR